MRNDMLIVDRTENALNALSDSLHRYLILTSHRCSYALAAVIYVCR